MIAARIVSMNQSFVDMIQSIVAIIYNIVSLQYNVRYFPDNAMNIVHSYVNDRLSIFKKLHSQYARYVWRLAYENILLTALKLFYVCSFRICSSMTLSVRPVESCQLCGPLLLVPATTAAA